MKLGKLITGFVLSTLLAVGVGVGIGSGNKELKAAEAASVPSGVYVDISNCQWKNWGATLSNIKAHFFKGGTGYTTWPGTAVTSVTVNGKSYGYASVPSGATQVIFNAWGGNTNQNKTENLDIPTDGKLLFSVTSYNTGSVQTGSWSNLDVIKPSTSLLTPSASTGRVFINNDSAHQDWKSNCTLGIRVWGGSASTLNSRPVTSTVFVVSWFDSNYGDVWYAYSDIYNDCTAFQVVRLSGDSQSATVWSYSDSVTKSNTSFSCIYYLVGGSTDSMPLSPGGAKDSHAGNVLLTKVLESYDTCSSSNYNGYGDATELNTNFYQHADEWARNQTSTSRGGVSATNAKHFEGMIARKSGGVSLSRFNYFGNLINPKNSSAILIVSLTSIVTVAAFAGYFFYKKKKED